MASTIATLKIDLSGVKLTTQELQHGSAGRQPHDVGYAPMAEMLQTGTGDRTEVLVREFSRILGQMEAKLNEESAKMQAQMDSILAAGGLRGSPGGDGEAGARRSAPVLDGSARPGGEGAPPRAVDELRQEVLAWKVQQDAKIEFVVSQLEKVHDEIPRVALKAGRIALRAVDMAPQDRRGALAAVQLKESRMDSQLGAQPDVFNMALMSQSPATSPRNSGTLTPRTDFNNTLASLGNKPEYGTSAMGFSGLKLGSLSSESATVLGLGNLSRRPEGLESGLNSGATTPRSMGIPDEHMMPSRAPGR